MSRPRKSKSTLTSLDECDRAMGELLLAALSIESAQTARDAAIAKAREQYAPEIEAAETAQADLTLQLRDYYMSRLDALECAGARSIKLTHGVMGRRLSPPAVKLLNKSWTWSAVLSRIIEAGLKHLVRWRDPEIDKTAILRANLDPDKLGNLGLKLDQEELFFAEPNRDEQIP